MHIPSSKSKDNLTKRQNQKYLPRDMCCVAPLPKYSVLNTTWKQPFGALGTLGSRARHHHRAFPYFGQDIIL